MIDLNRLNSELPDPNYLDRMLRCEFKFLFGVTRRKLIRYKKWTLWHRTLCECVWAYSNGRSQFSCILTCWLVWRSVEVFFDVDTWLYGVTLFLFELVWDDVLSCVVSLWVVWLKFRGSLFLPAQVPVSFPALYPSMCSINVFKNKKFNKWMVESINR